MQTQPQPDRGWIVGAARDCDIVLSGPAVSLRHCVVHCFPQGMSISDLGSASGTWVNGRRLEPGEAVWIAPGDALRAGPDTVIPWPLAHTPPGPAAEPDRARRVITIGRSPESSRCLDFPMISWHHARLVEKADGSLVAEDLGSLNGTYLNSLDQRIHRVLVRPDDSLYFGSMRIPVHRLLRSGNSTIGEGAAGTINLRGDRFRIGRNPSSDLVVDYPSVSWDHAEIVREGGQTYVLDLGAKNGTFVDGRRIRGRALILPGQQIGLAGYRFRLNDGGRIERLEFHGNVTLEVRGVCVDARRGGQRLLGPVSLTVFPSELVAVMGTSGAGKTTLLQTLCGYTVLDGTRGQGAVYFNCLDLNEYFDQFRLVIGYVPQEDIMHSSLTVGEVLRYTARLRTDLSEDQINQRVSDVLASLGIAGLVDQPIGSPSDPGRKVISGGQRKRVNIAIELMVDPDVLVMDEPTSGLSSEDSYRVVDLLRKLADGDAGHPGKTILVTIHQPSTEMLERFDNLIMLARRVDDRQGVHEFPARLAYYGPAYPQSIEFFAPDAAAHAQRDGQRLSPEMIVREAAARTGAEWAECYEHGHGKTHFDRYVTARRGTIPASQSPARLARPSRPPGLGQWWLLCRRNSLLKMRDWGQLLFQLGQTAVFGVVLAFLYRNLAQVRTMDMMHWPGYTGKITTAHFMMAVAAMWFGCNNAVRDIVGERPVFIRERMVNLKLPSYVLSKFAVNLVWGLLQLAIMLAVIYPLSGLTAPLWQVASTLMLLLAVGISLGLLLSACAPSTETAIALMPIFLLPMILLGGGLTPVHRMSAPLSAISMAMPTRWAYESNVLAEADARDKVRVETPCGPAESTARRLAETAQTYRNAANNCQQRFSAYTKGVFAAKSLPPVDIPAAGPEPEVRDVADNAFPAENAGAGEWTGWSPRISFVVASQNLGGFLTMFLCVTIGVLRWKDIR